MDPRDDQLAEMRMRAWALARRRRGQEMIEMAEGVLNILQVREPVVSEPAGSDVLQPGMEETNA